MRGGSERSLFLLGSGGVGSPRVFAGLVHERVRVVRVVRGRCPQSGEGGTEEIVRELHALGSGYLAESPQLQRGEGPSQLVLLGCLPAGFAESLGELSLNVHGADAVVVRQFLADVLQALPGEAG